MPTSFSATTTQRRSIGALLRTRRLRWRKADYLSRIENLDDWLAVAARQGVFSVARTEIVKFVIDLHDRHQTYFQNTKKWVSHAGFVQRFIDPRIEHARFMVAEYVHQDRRYVLGNVMHYLDGDQWTVELDPSNNLDADRVEWMFGHIRERLAIARDLRYRPRTLAHASCIEHLGGRFPVLPREAIDASVEYQPVVLGIAHGYLRIIRGRLDVSSVRPYDIVVVDHVPVEIPPVAGLITGELQAPLAHVAVLCRNRNTPDMALRGAADRQEFHRLEGELVQLTVAGQDYGLFRADRASAEAAWLDMRPRSPLRPHFDLRPVELIEVASLNAAAASYVGAKAAQVGELGRIDGVRTPGGFVVPFSAYAAHIEAAGLTDEIAAMLVDPALTNDQSARAHRLEHLRTAITSTPVDPDLLAAIATMLRATSHCGPCIFRSSTNAEDLAGFNGAGLYESVVVPADPTTEQIAEALRSVWASVWLQRAFEEREWYRIDHRFVVMAVLIQPFIDHPAATGVAITKNPFSAELSGVFINAQARGASVTGAVGGELPEQYLVNTWTDGYAVELVGRSSVTNGALILSQSDVHRLTDQLLRIHETMLPANADSANAMDVEFALTADRQFVILQARPYKVDYGLDRERVTGDLTLLDRVARRVVRLVYRVLPDRREDRTGSAPRTPST